MELDENVITDVQRARKKVVRLDGNKCNFKKQEVTFVGHILTGERIVVDPYKVEAIDKILKPTNAVELSSFLGMLNYVSKFIHNLSERNVHL